MKTINFIKILLIASVLTVFFSTCCRTEECKNKNNPPKTPEYYEYWLGEAKDYMYFKTGSWWIYKNMQTNKLDTWLCRGNNLDTFVVKGTESYSKHITFTNEYMRCLLYSLRYNRFMTIYSSQSNPDVTPIYNYQSSTRDWAIFCVNTIYQNLILHLFPNIIKN